MPDKLNITELDYQTIKKNLIDYFKEVTDSNGNLIYQDYDFNGSALNTLMGILAYNTHYNAMVAHMAVNETFIDSAQLRSSVVSSAKLLGYVPNSYTSALTDVSLSIPCKTTDPNLPATIFLDKNTLFSNAWQGRLYYYTFVDGVTLNKDGNYYKTLSNVKIVEGQRVTKKYQVNSSYDYEKYIIDDENININSLIVRVYENANNNSSVKVFSRYSDTSKIDPNSSLYYLSENTLGRYEITFGNDIISKKLKPLNVIEVEYIVTNGSSANGSPGPFLLVSSNQAIQNYTSGTMTVTPVNITSGGSERESIESVRRNATSVFVTQNRAVTAEDYRSIIQRDAPNIKSVSVWGGEDNIPPQYGKVFISVNKDNNSQGIQLNSSEKETIHTILRGKKVLSITPEIVDVEYVNIVLDVLYKYNSNILNITENTLNDQIRTNVIEEYNSRLNEFGKIFRYSEFTKSIDTYSPAIINSHVRVYLSKTIDIDPSAYTNKIVKYGAHLTVDDDHTIIGYVVSAIPSNVNSSDQWTYNGQRVYLADKAHSTNSDIRILYTYVISSDGSTRQTLNPNVGTLTLSTGVLQLSQRDISDDPFRLTLDLIPNSNDIVSRRNQIITLDSSRCSIQGYVDEIEVGGSSLSVNYKTFKRDR